MTRAFYHVTTRSCVGAILSDGLRPMTGPRSEKLGEPKPSIHMFDDRDMVEDAIGNWLGDDFEARGEPEAIVLEVTLEKEAVSRLVHDGFAHLAFDPIPATCIRELAREPTKGPCNV